MHKIKKLLVCASFIGFNVHAQESGSYTQIEKKDLSALKHMLQNSEDWETSSKNQTPLDILLLQNTKAGASRKNIEGKSEMILPNQQVNIAIKWENLSFGIPVKFKKDASTANMPESWAISSTVRQMNEELEKVNSPCRVRQGMSINELKCVASPAAFLNHLMAFEIVDCPANNRASCIDFGEKKFLLRYLVKQESVKSPNTPLITVVKEEVSKGFAKGVLIARDRSGNKLVSPNLIFSNESEDAHIYVITRADYEGMTIKDRSQWSELGSLTANQVVSNYAWIEARKLESKNSAQSDLQKMQKVAMANAVRLSGMQGSQTALAAVSYYGYESHAVCTIGNSNDPKLQASRIEVLNSPSFKKWIAVDIKTRFSSVKPDLESLYASLQNRTCTAVIDTAENVAKLAAALNRDRAAISVMESTFDEGMLADIAAQKKGYRNNADQKLAESMGLNHPTQLEYMREVGLVSLEAVEKARARMLSMNYAKGQGSVLQFRRDELEASRFKKTANQIFEERVAADNAGAKAAESKIRTDEERARKALGLVSNIGNSAMRQDASDRCKTAILTAQRSEHPQEFKNNWYNARVTCEQVADR